MNQHSLISTAAPNHDLLHQFKECRALTLSLCARMSDADASVQSMDDASPAKWHLAHTSWFFETFILRDFMPEYRLFNEDFPFLFNSYYEAEGERHSRFARGLITRPSLDEIIQYRSHVNDAVAVLMISSVSDDKIAELITLGIHHEQQHQELLLTDILHLFSCNPTYPALWPAYNEGQADDAHRSSDKMAPLNWIAGPSGIISIGHQAGKDDNNDSGFAFDCEGPAHDILLNPYVLADRTINNGEWLQFLQDGGYQNPSYWLADGWAWVNDQKITAPLYWIEKSNQWFEFGLDGLTLLNSHAPVTHISHYEADAFASWASENLSGCAGARLPTEGEWEAFAKQFNPNNGHQLDKAGAVKPCSSGQSDQYGLFGNVWEWTGSAFRPYPKFVPAKGAVGEYNGKFMSSQSVLKGGSCATPRGHLRASYRNFFYPHQRWQFTGLRLAKYIER